MPLAEREYLRGKHESSSSFARRKRSWGTRTFVIMIVVAWVVALLGGVSLTALIIVPLACACAWPVVRADWKNIALNDWEDHS